ncbi:MAG: polysaccharide deacetylase family protein [Ignavibacteriaceae bacterium]|nr:polysaccharide deacetylase family protein [Ignavibacterium sp.]MCC6256508.1 polysaccharide deacetylase family protein [Ignavibacteriaceae bacterium]HMN23310.1 polysaccharide deacetylase family protein [Ignavibacteriaceae bacterium]HRN26459.1 polysaccharide deacetylase family protein [Ignavibacteriaceae bacterium]HRP92044.1 polysaccharide deacetylase family protein [Ignavibacteriaceae bacterium]
MKYLYTPPSILRKIFSDFYWNTNNNKVLLTFDDGPNPETTEIILKKLSNEKIKALFFCVGENIQKYPELTKSILSEGHSIGNHTFNHKILSKISNQEKDSQINSFNSMVGENFNYDVKYFRPPHGKFQLSTSGLMKKHNLKNIMWSLLTYDYKNDISIVKFAAQKYLKNNSIIVLHDSSKSKNIILDSISLISDEVRKKNYQFSGADECLN